MSKWQRYTLGVGALIAWLILIGVSLTANYRFAYSLGSTELDRYIIGAGSIASDLFKAAAPVALLWCLSRTPRMWTAAAAVLILGVVATVYSIAAATGFAAGNRYHAFEEANAKVRATKDLEKDIDRNTARRDWLPAQQPVPVIEAEIARLKIDPGWVNSVYCTAPKGPAHVSLCRQIAEKDIALAAAKAGDEADKQIKADREKLAKEGRTVGDPQIEAWSKMTGIDPQTVLRALIVLTVALIELGSGLGLTVALALLIPETTALGRALAVVKPGGNPATPRVPVPSAPAPSNVRPVKAAASFKQPVASTPVRDGFSSKMSAVIRPQAVTLVRRA